MRHFADPKITPGGQGVFVGTRLIDDGWAVAVVRIDDCTDQPEAFWLGTHIHDDLLTYIRFTNQEDVPPEAVDVEIGVPAGGVTWSVAVYVTLVSMEEAETMKTFLAIYAQPGVLFADVADKAP